MVSISSSIQNCFREESLVISSQEYKAAEIIFVKCGDLHRVALVSSSTCLGTDEQPIVYHPS